MPLNVAVLAQNGPPLVMLHGVTRRWQTFLPLMPTLSQRWQIHAVDFHGHGNSARRPGQYHAIDYVEDAAAYVNSLSEPAVLYGHSLGAMVAAATAARRPERVAGVILEDPPLDTMGRRIGETVFLSYFSGLQRWAGDSRSVAVIARELADLRQRDPATRIETRLGDVRDAASLRFTAASLKCLDPEALAPIAAADWLAGMDFDSIFRGLSCPALLLQADPSAGGMLIDLDAEFIVERTPDVTPVKLPGVPHLMHWSQTPGVLNLALNFLESLERA